MVAREHSEPARVDGKALVQAELGGEVRDQEVGRPVPLEPPRLVAAVARQARLHAGEPLDVVRRERAGQILVRQLGEKSGGVVVQPGEAARLELGKEEPGLRDPREGEVARDRDERRAQRRAVVYPGHERAPYRPSRAPRAEWLLAFWLPGEL